MVPNSPPIDTNLKLLLATCHKETQTTFSFLRDASSATSSGNINTCDKGSLTVIENSELYLDPKDPTDATIIRDVYIEETHDHANPGETGSDNAVAKRYTYCREVVQPYLKEYPNDCPVSNNQSIRDALISAHEDFPDYEPCLKDCDKHLKEDNDKDITKDIEDKDTLEDCLLSCEEREKQDLEDKKKCFPAAEDNCRLTKKGSRLCRDTCPHPDTCPSILKSKSKSNTSVTSSKSNMDPDEKIECDEPKVKIRDHRCPKKSHCPPPADPCQKPCDPPPGPPSACKNRTPPSAGTSACGSRPVCPVESCPDQPQKKKEKVCPQPRNDMTGAPAEEKKKSMIDSPGETIATIKSAVEDFFGKVYQTTKDAVTVIKTESARHLSRITATKSGCSNTDLIPQKVHESKSSETITSYNYFRSTENPDVKNQETENGVMDDNLDGAGNVIAKIFAKVDSTISMVSDQVSMQKVTSLLKLQRANKSSDNVNSDSNNLIANSTSRPNSVFTAIKTKIVSMFGESDSEMKEIKKEANDTEMDMPSDNESETSVTSKPTKK